MWSSKAPHHTNAPGLPALLACACAIILAGCTVQPLNGQNTGTRSSSLGSISYVLKATEVDPVKDRVSQQVRNKLLFALNGGAQTPNGQYRISLKVSSSVRAVSIQGGSNAPLSAQLLLTASYALVDKKIDKIVASGQRRSLAAFDRTSQSFANARAQRDAENRAALELGQKLKLAVAQDISKL